MTDTVLQDGDLVHVIDADRRRRPAIEAVLERGPVGED